MTAREVMIRAEGLRKRYGALEVLRGVALDVARGEGVSIGGASGAGKTTLLQIIGSLTRPDGGRVTLGGVDPFVLSDRELSRFRNCRVGFVFQFHRLLPEFTAFENVCLPGLIGGRDRREVGARAAELLDLMGLAARRDHKPAALSGGEQQRAAIARALINSPSVLLADEPSGNLDTHNREEIHRLFFELRERLGQTVVIVTHDESLAARADRTITMSDGRIVGCRWNTKSCTICSNGFGTGTTARSSSRPTRSPCRTASRRATTARSRDSSRRRSRGAAVP